MDKIITLQTQQGRANVLASTIDGFIQGNKRGTGYVIIRGVGTPITDAIVECEREWKSWVDSQVTTGVTTERTFEFKDHEDSPITVRLSDVTFIRRHNHTAVVHLNNNISIRSCEDYYDLRDRFEKRLSR